MTTLIRRSRGGGLSNRDTGLHDLDPISISVFSVPLFGQQAKRHGRWARGPSQIIGRMLQDPSKNDDARFAPLGSSLTFTYCLKVQEIARVPGWESASIRNKAPCVQDVVRLSMIPQKTWTPRPLAHFVAWQARFNDEIKV